MNNLYPDAVLEQRDSICDVLERQTNQSHPRQARVFLDNLHKCRHSLSLSLWLYIIHRDKDQPETQ